MLSLLKAHAVGLIKGSGREKGLALRSSRRYASAESACAAPPQHRWHGFDKDLEIQPERPPTDVLEVQLQPLLEWKVASARNLPEAGDPGLHAETLALDAAVE